MNQSTGKPLQVLISGAGVAGPVLVHWLSRAGAECTVVERASSLRSEGQTVDVRVEGVDVLRRMGVVDAVKAATTAEKGLEILDAKGTAWARFPQSGSDSFTGEIEIVRGTLAQILYDAAKDDAQWLFGQTIERIEHAADGQSAEVTLSGEEERPPRKFDMVLLCEGLFSKTRSLVFSEPIDAPVRRLKFFVCGFSVPYDAALGLSREEVAWSKWRNLPGRRQVFLRPLQGDRISVGFAVLDARDRVPRELFAARSNVAKQKAYFKALFADDNQFVTPYLLSKMDAADDFYVQEVGQAYTKAWSKGRVALVGDTASCPSAFTGMGTTAAIVQAYTLAAAIAQHGADHAAAFAQYERELRPWVENIQSLPPGIARGIAVPETAWGIRVLLLVASAIALVLRTGIVGAASVFFSTRKPLPLADVAVFDEAKSRTKAKQLEAEKA